MSEKQMMGSIQFAAGTAHPLSPDVRLGPNTTVASFAAGLGHAMPTPAVGISDYLSTLNNEISDLYTEIEALAGSIEPVLMPEPPASPAAALGQAEPMTNTLAAEVRAQLDRLRIATDRVRRLRQRLSGML